jgi:PilZ domain
MSGLKKLFERLTTKERRRAERLAAPRLGAYYWTNAAPKEHGIRDISSTGLYLLTEERWYPGTLVMMTLQKKGEIEGEADASIAVQSKAVRWGSDGVGLQFVLSDTKDPNKGHSVLKDGADRKSLERFLAGFTSDEGNAVVNYIVLPIDKDK